MSPVTHFLSGWVVANVALLNRRERAAVTIAAVIPDLDGAGIFAEILTRNSAHRLLWFSEYHHVLHNLLFGLIVAGVAGAVATKRWLTASAALAALHIHLLQDLVGSRGPDGFGWPIPYLLPFTDHGAWIWHGQWALNAWPNLLLTVTLLALTLWLAIVRGFSPIEMFSREADRAVVAALRARF
jgi:inner membrane protein